MLLACCTVLWFCGCGNLVVPANLALSSALSVLPSTASLEPGLTTTFAINPSPAAACDWSSNAPAILASNGGGSFTAIATGSALISATCAGRTGSASVAVAPLISTRGYTITSGGTYSGTFRSDDPNVPAVTIATTQPVILENSTIVSRGDVIHIAGPGSSLQQGSHVTIRNVTGTAIDPGVPGLTRGSFVRNENAASLAVLNCTITGVAFGIYLAPTTANSITIDNNLAFNMEDRPSDGAGGLIASRATKGHFIQLNNVVALNGADIAWNQVVDTPGQASVEDIIDMAQSYGSAASTINIHDNYLQGAFSPGSANYTGGGIMSEGDHNLYAQTSGFLQVFDNQVVMSANYGIAISSGHDITMSGNRVVSCGIDSAGARYAGLSGVAAGMSNANDSSFYFNDHIVGTTGGLVRPDANGNPMQADFWTPGVSASANNTFVPAFDDPCWTNGKVLSNHAEAVEWSAWIAKLQHSGQVLGDTRLTPARP